LPLASQEVFDECRDQLQAPHAPAPQAGAGLAAAVDVVLGASAGAAGGASPFAASAGFALPPPLKSVAYQPLPFSAKPGAVRFFETVPETLHLRQAVSGASENFCIASNVALHAVQWYS
jgi:hypothetical protein